MINREDLIYRLCSEFNIGSERVDQNNIDTLLKFMRPSIHSSPLSVEEIIWWIKNHGIKTGLRVFVSPGYRYSFLTFRMRNDIYEKRREDDIVANGLELKHITGRYLKLIELQIDTIELLSQKSPCELFYLLSMDNHEIEEVQINLKKHGFSLKDPVDCCRHKWIMYSK